MATANLLQTSVSGGTQNALSLQGDGVFFPKASTTSRLALTLTTTDKGFIVYDTTDNNIYFWNGAAWESVPSSGDAGANGSVQYNDNGIVSGATNFVYNKATGAVAITGAATATLSVGTATADIFARFYTRSIGFDSSGSTVLQINGASYGGLDLGAAGVRTFSLTSSATETSITTATNIPINFNINGATKMTLNTAGNLAFVNGQGIDFSATPGTGTSELLNDYEEGVWSPVLATDTVNFTSVGYAIQAGKYTKVGNLVTFAGTIQTSSVVKGLASGAVVITGLPFAQPAVDARGGVNCFAVSAWAVDFPLSGEIITSAIYLLKRATSVSATATLTVADVATGASSNLVRFSGQYYV